MKVLIIEDNPDHFEIIEDAFLSIPELDTQIVPAITLMNGIEKLSSEPFDICLCDLQLPDSPIENTVEWLSDQTHSLPMVILTSLDSVDIAEALLNRGVQDYLAKDDLTPRLLYKTCRYAIERWKHQQTVAEHNKDMQAFCASLSHDFNGHINRIMGVSKALQSDLADRVSFSPSDLQWFRYLNKSTHEIHNLVSDLHEYLSVGYADQEFVAVNINDVLQNVGDSLRSSLQVEFTLNIPDDNFIIQGNLALLNLLFQNLLSNSVKFNERVPVIDISCFESGDCVELSLQDNGIGFDLSSVEKIFKPFSRLDKSKNIPGSGLGLSIVKRIIEHHHGEINVHSEIELGTRFTIKFLKP